MSSVTVRLFASYAESFGANNVQIELSPSGTVADLLAELRSLPGSDILPATPLVAVNYKFATSDQLIRGSDEVALIPPVAGG